MRRRRQISVFGMSFLDVMFCGFGSVVLLVMLVNSTVVAERRETHADLRTEVARLEREAIASEAALDELRAAIDDSTRDAESAEASARAAASATEQARAERSSVDSQTVERRASVETLQRELTALESRGERLAAETERDAAAGENVRRFLGDGDRQYLTGLKMGGERILILVDASASMLDESIVNVLRRRNMPDAAKRAAPKWRRAVATVEWLVANLPPDARFQLYGFGTDARALLAGSDGTWLDARDAASVEGAIAGLHALAAAGGTSLHAAFDAIATLEPRPDNVMLITDGLPTRGASAPAGTTVGPAERLGHFERAVARLPDGLPINAILFPMEGDPLAPAAYWQLAMRTRGAFIAPSKDWP